MNEVFRHLTEATVPALSFLTWYKKNYKDLPVFINLSFEHQLGVYIKYYEEVKAMTLNATPTGYIIYYLDKYFSMDKVATQSGYFYQKYECPKDTILNNYAKGIIWMIDNDDLPF
jgi:hypothetical protein